jgi:hypothetical protein
MKLCLLFSAVALGALLGWLGDAPPVTCELRVELVDAASGKALSGLVRIEDDEGLPVRPAGLFCRGHGLAADAPIGRWWVLLESATLRVPAAALRLEAFAGLETELAAVALDLRGKERHVARVPLKRFFDARRRGLYSANTHIHLARIPRPEAERYLREIPHADGLDLVFLSYLERAGDDAGYVSNGFSDADLAALSTSGVLFGNGEEHRHNFGAYDEGYGHVMFLDIVRRILPVSIGPGITKQGTDAPPLRAGIEAARRDGAAAIWCHNDWGFEDLPNWLGGRLDAQNIFDGGEHGSYRDSFYRALDIGLKVPFSTGTDWFQYDFSRVYVPLDGPPTVKAWLKALAAGKSSITNGPFLELEVDGRAVGETIDLPAPRKLKVRGRALGRVDFERIELIANGAVIRDSKSRRVESHHAADIDAEIDLLEPCWIALRTPPPPVPNDPELKTPVPLNELGQPLFAHTSPIYVAFAGRDVFKASTAEELLAEIERNQAAIREKGLFATDLERQSVLAVHEEAARELKRRIAAR